MTVTVKLEARGAEALEALRRQAAAKGISLDGYLAELAASGQTAVPNAATGSPHELDADQFRHWLAEVSAGMPETSPLPTDFSRADFYDDHD